MAESLLPAPPDSHRLLDRLLDTPQLARVIPRLQPELLHRVIERCGLEDCSELVALTTPAQLTRILDLDLWRSAQAGTDEQFDAARFGVWIEVLLESGAKAAAQKLADMDVNLVVAGLAQHARVFDYAQIAPYTTSDGEEFMEIPHLEDERMSVVGGYMLLPRHPETPASWTAIVEVLMSLEAVDPDRFHDVMGQCRRLSNDGFEDDGLDDLLGNGDQAAFEMASDRAQRREQQGYVTPAQARAFLQMARERRATSDAEPRANPIARAYFRAVAEPSSEAQATTDPPPASDDTAAAVAAVVDVLAAEGIVPPAPRALLAGSQEEPHLGRIQSYMQSLLEHDSAAYAARTEELAYLANTLVAGCSLQARPFTAQQASDAAVAICNLGLAHSESAAAIPDLIGVFEAGWRVLHHDVCMHAASELIDVLSAFRCPDEHIQEDLDMLRIQLTKAWRAGAPWHARGAFEVLASLDMPAWAALLGLVDECPVIHAVIAASRDARTRAVSASAFEFIAEKNQIVLIREFLRSLPDRLR